MSLGQGDVQGREMKNEVDGGRKARTGVGWVGDQKTIPRDHQLSGDSLEANVKGQVGLETAPFCSSYTWHTARNKADV